MVLRKLVREILDADGVIFRVDVGLVEFNDCLDHLFVERVDDGEDGEYHFDVQ